MPQPFNDAIITDRGAALLARVESSAARLEITKVVVGDGTYPAAEKEPASLRGKTALKHQRNVYAPSSVTITAENAIKIATLISNVDPVTGEALVDRGYYINEIGVYAKEYGGAASTECLYCIAVTAGSTGDYMPAYLGGGAAQIVQDIYLTVGNAATTYVNIAGAAYLASDAAILLARVAALEDLGLTVVDGKINATYNT
jgi:hypothetical protein